MRVILLAGGSGGHISPAFAVASEIRKKDPAAELVFFCSRNAIDQTIYTAAGEEYRRIFSGKFRRYFDWRNFSDPFLIVLGIFQSLSLLVLNRPDVIFSKGGFASVAPAIAAFLLNIPIVVHESDSEEGLANKIVSTIAQKKLTAFPGNEGIHTGTPIRSEILTGSKERGIGFLHFSSTEKPIVFFYGGSQGSRLMNGLVEKILPNLTQTANVVWIHGDRERHIEPSLGLRAYPYLHREFSDVLAAADVVVSRAGSSSLFEAAAAKKAMLLIPLKSAAGNHQEKNAEYFQQKNAAIVLPEEQLSAERLLEQVETMARQPELRKQLGKNAAALVKLDAAEKIAEEVLRAVKAKS